MCGKQILTDEGVRIRYEISFVFTCDSENNGFHVSESRACSTTKSGNKRRGKDSAECNVVKESLVCGLSCTKEDLCRFGKVCERNGPFTGRRSVKQIRRTVCSSCNE